MAIQDHRISDFKSFGTVTSEPRQVAGLYYFSTLDCLADLAYKVSHDFFKRPHLYTTLGSIGPPKVAIAAILARLHAQYGSNERVLDKAQRDEIYRGLFGQNADYPAEGDESGDFVRLRNELVNACAAFAERVFDTGVEMLRERVRTTHRPFHQYLTGLLGDSVRWSKDQALSELTESISYAILRSHGVASVFGISTFAKSAWPYVEDSNADKEIEQISMWFKGTSKNPCPQA